MKKLLFTLFFVAAGLTCLADEYYIVGDATPWGWVTGDGRKPAQMTETSSGVYVWTGLLKRAEGFFICNSLSGWSGFGSSVPKASGAYDIADTGSDTYTDSDNKWNPVNTDWQFFTITLNTNDKKVYWEAGDTFTADGDGYYQISNAQELNWFSIIVNNNQSAKAKLTADIDYTAYPKGFIGTNSKRFAGTFDGQEHTITIKINNNATCTGLFGVIEGATIKNLIVEGNAESSAKLLGGLGGVSYGNCTIENIVVKTAIKFTGTGDATLGGIFGDMEAASTVKNCAFYGSVDAPNGENVRGLASWCSGGVQFVNCIIAPTEVIAASGSDYANGSYTNNNCIKVAADDAGLASGEICYTMNGDQSNINWYQTLGTDDLPVPFSSHSQVFANGQLLCDGTSAGGDIVYSNSNESVIPPHTDNGAGRCSVCGKLIPDFLALDDEGFYAITNAADLNWFAAWVKEENQSAKAKLTADIDYTAYPQGFIGLDNAFSGTFDGQQHTITIAITTDAKIRGLFASINGATIKNLVVDGSIKSSFNNIGGLGGQTDGDNIVENVIVKTTITFTPGSGDASIGGFFPYINSGTTAFSNCAFYGSVKAGTATGNAGLVSWSSGSCLAENCLVAPAEIEANAFDDYARGKYSTENCYRVDLTDARLASGELCYLLNGSTCFNAAWTQTIGTDALPVPFTTQGFVNYITSAGYATLFIPTTDVTIPAGVNAYTGKVEGEILKLTLIKGAISKEDAVVLKGEEGFYSFVPTTGATPAAQNDITAATTEMEAEGKYILAEGDEGVGFYKATGYIPAGKAYIVSTTGIKVFTFDWDNPTSINEELRMKNEEPGAIYNLAGQRIQKMQKGINVVNGKKVMF